MPSTCNEVCTAHYAVVLLAHDPRWRSCRALVQQYDVADGRPLKVRIAVRDLWGPTTAPAFSRLKEELGTEPTVSPEWGMLHTALGGVYNDDTLFVQQTSSLVAAWAEAASRVCDQEELGEKLVDKIAGTQLRLFLDVSCCPTAAD